MLDRYETRDLWYDTFPETETVTLRSRSAADQSSFTDYVIGHAKQRPIDSAPADLGGTLVEDVRCLWQLWQDALDGAGAPAPREGDAVVQTLADGETTVTWYVERLKNKMFGNVFDLTCLKQAERA